MPRTRIADIRRREIIEAAYKIFSEKGYHKTKMTDIATELELSHATLYRYFSNKRDIAAAVTDIVIGMITAVVLAEPAEDMQTLEDYRERLKRIGDRFFKLHEYDPKMHDIFFTQAAGVDESIARKLREGFDRFTAYTEEYLETGMKRGFLRPDIHVHETALAINAMLWEAARRLSEETGLSEEAKKVWQETIIGLMLYGLATQAGREPSGQD